MIVSGRPRWTTGFSLTSLSPFRRPISLVMFVLLWNLVIPKNECIKICFLACKRYRSAAQDFVCIRLAVAAYYPPLCGKAKSTIDLWLPHLCFKFPLGVLTAHAHAPNS